MKIPFHEIPITKLITAIKFWYRPRCSRARRIRNWSSETARLSGGVCTTHKVYEHQNYHIYRSAWCMIWNDVPLHISCKKSSCLGHQMHLDHTSTSRRRSVVWFLLHRQMQGYEEIFLRNLFLLFEVALKFIHIGILYMASFRYYNN